MEITSIRFSSFSRKYLHVRSRTGIVWISHFIGQVMLCNIQVFSDLVIVFVCMKCGSKVLNIVVELHKLFDPKRFSF
ncbi:hypothetical protein [Ancylomarina longa]|uniref:hypothetical protein n=1 Tax=Ancylomarina longa TaxID=2487017 RepID=UPI000FCBD864|nr:hypothetical protein [Ancylomarina longa]